MHRNYRFLGQEATLTYMPDKIGDKINEHLDMLKEKDPEIWLNQNIPLSTLMEIIYSLSIMNKKLI